MFDKLCFVLSRLNVKTFNSLICKEGERTAKKLRLNDPQEFSLLLLLTKYHELLFVLDQALKSVSLYFVSTSL